MQRGRRIGWGGFRGGLVHTTGHRRQRRDGPHHNPRSDGRTDCEPGTHGRRKSATNVHTRPDGRNTRSDSERHGNAVDDGESQRNAEFNPDLSTDARSDATRVVRIVRRWNCQ